MHIVYKYFFLIILFFIIFYNNVQAEMCYSNITISKPDYLKTVSEKQIIYEAVAVSKDYIDYAAITSSNWSDQAKYVDIVTARVKEIDLNIETSLLFSDNEEISIYAQPNTNAKAIGYLKPPAQVLVINIQDDYACIRVSPEKTGWVHLRYVNSNAFQKTYQKYYFSTALLIEKELGLARVYYYSNKAIKLKEVSFFGVGSWLLYLGGHNLAQIKQNTELLNGSSFFEATKVLSVAKISVGLYLCYQAFNSLLFNPEVTFIYMKKAVLAEDLLTLEDLTLDSPGPD